MKENKDWWSADHWARRSAIQIIETIWEKAGKKSLPKGEKWYDLEDEVVEIIKQRYENKKV